MMKKFIQSNIESFYCYLFLYAKVFEANIEDGISVGPQLMKLLKGLGLQEGLFLLEK